MVGKTKLIPNDTLEKATEILKAIGHHDRLQIVNILLRGECNVSEMVKLLGALQSQTSQQLTKLKNNGIVKSRKEANRTGKTR